MIAIQSTRRVLAKALLVFLVTGALATSGQAQVSQAPPPRPQVSPNYYTYNELESCRATLAGICTTLRDLSDILPSASRRHSAELALQQFQSFTPEQLALCMPQMTQINELSAALSSLKSQMANKPLGGPKAGLVTCPDPPVFPASHCEDFPNAPYFIPDDTVDGWDDVSGPFELTAGQAVMNGADLFLECFAKLGLDLADGIYAAINDGSEQCAAGFNAAAVAVPFAIILSAVKGIVDVITTISSNVDSAENEGSYLRLNHLHLDMGQMAKDVEGLKAQGTGSSEKIDQLSEDVASLRQEVEALRKASCEIIRLLHTPEKKRASTCETCADQPGFPYEWAQKK